MSDGNGAGGAGDDRWYKAVTSGPVGVGLALVALPTLLLAFGTYYFGRLLIVGLPLLAILGLMILFGSLALVAMLFKRLDLSDTNQPLALPEGSIRAAVALALIVLFAIISIMLFQSTLGTPYPVAGLSASARDDLLKSVVDRVVAVNEGPCAAAVPPGAGAACAESDRRYVVHLRPGSSNDTHDLAKQLLILVGTLMTSVTSYYFASRTQSAVERSLRQDLRLASTSGSGIASAKSEEGAGADHLDGCDVPVTDLTADDELPPARGGVAGG